MQRLGFRAGIFFALLLILGCHGAQTGPPAAAVESLPMHIQLQLQVFGLRETAIPADGPFPARGFRFAEDRVAPVEEPDTVAGVELTADQVALWMAALPKSGAVTVYAQQSFLVGPNFHAGIASFHETRYCSNWRIDADAALPQFASLTPGFAADLVPFIVAGSQDLLVSADIRVIAGALEPFQASGGFMPPEAPKPDRSPGKPPPPPAKPEIRPADQPVPLMVQLPRQTVLRLTTSVPVRPGRAVILAHYVKQYRSPVPVPARRPGSRPPAAADQPGRVQPIREHIFFIVAAQRSREEETKSDLPIVVEPHPRYALSVACDQWAPSRDGTEAAPFRPARKAQPPTAKGDLAEILRAAEGMRESPEAVAESFSVAATVKKPIHVEVGADRSYVAGIHRDSDEATSPRTFVISQASTGMRLDTQLEPAANGVSAALNGRFASPPRWDDRTILVPSARHQPEKPSDKDAKPAPAALPVPGGADEYHMQVLRQYTAEFKSSLELIPGETRVLPLTWRAAGIVPPEQESRLATVSLKALPDEEPKKEPPSSDAPAP